MLGEMVAVARSEGAGARRVASKLRQMLICIVSGSFVFGCSSVRSWDQCPGLYSGLRYNRERFAHVPLDGKLFFTLDLPLTAIFDTLALPATAFANPSQPTGGFPAGCRWAAHR